MNQELMSLQGPLAGNLVEGAPTQDPLAVYIHWPFCRSLCPYCNFNRYVANDVDVAPWRRAFEREIQFWGHRAPGRRVASVFFGGGTPSLMPPDLVASILGNLGSVFGWHGQPEITLEMNPNEMDKAEAFQAAGVNRISMGVQSFVPQTLTMLGRSHSVQQLSQALDHLRATGLRFSFDLIYGHRHHHSQHEGGAQWQHELDQAVRWVDEHLSLYQLTYEQGTPFYTQRNQSLDEDRLLQLEAWADTAMAGVGLYRYEISNYARPGAESQHNLIYWRYGDFLGIGPGAHGRLRDGQNNRWATHGHCAPQRWLDSVQDHGHGLAKDQLLDGATVLQEQLMMGLRLRSGIEWGHLQSRTPCTHNSPSHKLSLPAGSEVEDGHQDQQRQANQVGPANKSLQGLLDQVRARAEICQQQGLLEPRDDRLVATPRGWNVLNSVVEFLCCDLG
jgi:putative oxygen-independent coproporphyrinogen III oxidase